MTKSLHATALVGLLIFAHAATPIRADFHFWFIKEIYTNQSGSVQFIELFTTASGQQNLHPFHSITSTTSPPFPFPNDSPTPTNNRHMLIGTANLSTLPGGATPNYIIPSNFFSPDGDTINFGEGTSVRTFGAGNPIPTDGVFSLNWTGFASPATIAANSPRNHGNLGVSINRGDYNSDGVVDAADYVVWRRTLTQAASPAGLGADGNTSGAIDDGDFTLWRSRFGNVLTSGAGSGPAATQVSLTPEPSALLLAIIAWATLKLSRRHK